MELPTGLHEIVQTYGDPRPWVNSKEVWEREVLVVVKLAIPLIYAYDAAEPITRVRAHRLVAAELADALMTCIGNGVPANRLKYGGTYCWRSMRQTALLSTHTWGIAVDLEPALNPQGESWDDDGLHLDWRVIQVFQRIGWKWGGEFALPDPMHFQKCLGY